MAIVSVLGGSGFVGTHICHALVKKGHTVNVLTRKIKNDYFDPHPNIKLLEYETTNHLDVIKQHLKGSDILINLIGVFQTSKMQEKHVDFPLTLLNLCEELNIKQMLHFSALGTSVEAIGRENSSVYFKTKSQAEQDLLASGKEKQIAITVLKPSLMFGEGDKFFSSFEAMVKKMPMVLVPCPDSLFQPVYVDDVAKIVTQLLGDSRFFYRAIELAGPNQYRFINLVKMMARYNLKSEKKIFRMPDVMAKLLGKIMRILPNAPFTFDQYLSLQIPNILRNEDIFEELAIKKTSLESYLTFKYRFNGQDQFFSERQFAKRATK